MSPLEMQVRDAGPLDVEDQMVSFEDEFSPGRGHEACLAEPFVTATTRVACD